MAYIEQMTMMFGEPYVRAVFCEAFERQDERILQLEQSVSRAVLAGGITGVSMGWAYATGFVRNGYRMVEGAVEWALRLIGHDVRRLMLESGRDRERTFLLEQLVQTVPQLPAPETESSVRKDE